MNQLNDVESTVNKELLNTITPRNGESLIKINSSRGCKKRK